MVEQINAVSTDSVVTNDANFTISLGRFAQHGMTLQGELLISDCCQLGDTLLNDNSSVTFTLGFSLDERGFVLIQGSIAASLPLLCQRCCKPMTFALQTYPRLTVVESDDQATRVIADSDPLVIGEGPLLLKTIIEEELVLNMPMIPRHEQGECAWIFKQAAS